MLSSVVQRKTTALFHALDMDGDGLWERRDFEAFAEGLAQARGAVPGSPEADELRQYWVGLFDSLLASDADGDGRVTVEEALVFQEQHFTPDAVVGFARAVFPALDADGDGVIGPAEYRAYVSTSSITPELADEMFPRLDADGDGRITGPEFEQLYLDFFLSDDPDAPGGYLWGPF